MFIYIPNPGGQPFYFKKHYSAAYEIIVALLCENSIYLNKNDE